jgi:4-hydroxythreonine-4-phosphate dehydrogenase
MANRAMVNGPPIRIVITPGEPAGIGADLSALVATDHWGARNLQLVAVCDPELLAQRARSLGLKLDLFPFDPRSPRRPHRAGTMEVLSVRLSKAAAPGRLDPCNADYVLKTLAMACDGCLEGLFDALVTGPVHKGIINDAGVRFTGHTEFLAERCGAEPLMMLTTPGLRVALVTTHLPLKEVSAHITPEALERAVRVLHSALREKFGIPRPRIQVCGLNPHAGEGGYLGREEEEIIAPVLARLRAAGMDLRGPVSADTAFVPERLAENHAVLTMYHDQGLPVLKHIGFGHAVNITLGLPIIRTSVDHGTALERAGTGHVDSGSLRAALATAAEMVSNTAD